MPSSDVESSRVADVEVDDLELVVWRDQRGQLCVMEARCPHQWSHLGVEGVVDGCELVCTSHFWRFDRDGAGTKLAMSGRRDSKARIRTFPVKEEGDKIWAELPEAAASDEPEAIARPDDGS